PSCGYATCFFALSVVTRCAVRLLARGGSTAVYSLSLHDALPIFESSWQHERRRRLSAFAAPFEIFSPAAGGRCPGCGLFCVAGAARGGFSLVMQKKIRYNRKGMPCGAFGGAALARDRKSTRLNSSHVSISYAV